MGSDCSPEILFEAILSIAQELEPSYSFLIFATLDVYDRINKSAQKLIQTQLFAPIDFAIVTQEITMEDNPLVAVRQKKNSSLMEGIKALKKGLIHAFISAGNTGALLTAATLNLPKLPFISRAALMTTLPIRNGAMAILDIGGSVFNQAIHFIHFAEMGARFIQISKNIEKPKVALLNIGVESQKGTVEHKKAYELLSQYPSFFEFIGNVESREIFKGVCDVLVTDGFTGNILLKAMEGTADYILETMSHSLGSFQQEDIDKLRHQFSYKEYPGALLIGLEGIVIKCHGDTSMNTLKQSIHNAIGYAKQSLIAQLKLKLANSALKIYNPHL